MSCIDPYGAPEFLVDGVAYRVMVGTEMIRFGYYSVDDGEQILRVKLVFPTALVLPEQIATREFLKPQYMRMVHGGH